MNVPASLLLYESVRQTAQHIITVMQYSATLRAGRHDQEMDVEIADAIRHLTIEDVTAAAPGTAQASHRIVKIHPHRWRQGEASSSQAVVVCFALVDMHCIASLCNLPCSLPGGSADAFV